MVKNVKGGKGHKSIARKSLFSNILSSQIRIPENDLELFAVVTKFYGNLCDVKTHNKLELKCHIRGKFKGKSKRNAYIAVGKIILVGLRHYETTPKSCDLLHVFETTSYSTINSLPNYDLSELLNISSSLSTIIGSTSSTHISSVYNDIMFSEDDEEMIFPNLSERRLDKLPPIKIPGTHERNVRTLSDLHSSDSGKMEESIVNLSNKKMISIQEEKEVIDFQSYSLKAPDGLCSSDSKQEYEDDFCFDDI